MAMQAPHMKGNRTMNAPAPAPNAAIQLDGDEIKHLQLGDIYVDWAWNCRSKANVEASDGSETSIDGQGTGLYGLMTSLATDGQDTPIVVRPVGKDWSGKKTDKPFALVSGFRRYAAITRLNAPGELGTSTEAKALHAKIEDNRASKKSTVPNTANGTIRAVVRLLSDADARTYNTRENAARDDLTAPDMMYGIAAMHHEHKMTGVAIAASIGKSQNFVAKLLRISTLPTPVLKHWREGGLFNGENYGNTRVRQEDLDEIQKLDSKEKQIEAYQVFLAAQAKPDGEGEDEDGRAWFESAKKKAITMGTAIGALERDGFLKVTLSTKDGDWKDYVPKMVKVGKGRKPTPRDWRSLAKAAEKAYLAEREREEVEGEEGEDDEAAQ